MKAVSFLENDRGQDSSSVSRQSSETKPNTEFVLVSQELNCFMSNLTNPTNKIFMRLNLFKKFNFSQSQYDC